MRALLHRPKATDAAPVVVAASTQRVARIEAMSPAIAELRQKHRAASEALRSARLAHAAARTPFQRAQGDIATGERAEQDVVANRKRKEEAALALYRGELTQGRFDTIVIEGETAEALAAPILRQAATAAEILPQLAADLQRANQRVSEASDRLLHTEWEIARELATLKARELINAMVSAQVGPYANLVAAQELCDVHADPSKRRPPLRPNESPSPFHAAIVINHEFAFAPGGVFSARASPEAIEAAKKRVAAELAELFEHDDDGE